jgi:hypothetical protein
MAIRSASEPPLHLASAGWRWPPESTDVVLR